MEEGSGSFLSGLTSFQLGRMFQDHLDSSAETVAYMFGQRRQRRQADVHQSQIHALAAKNQSLTNENADLRRQLDEYKENYARLKEWADRMTPHLQAYVRQSKS